MSIYKYHVFCCINERPDSAQRECCMKKNSILIKDFLKKKVRENKVKNVRINQSGCLDQCENGPVIVIYPEGIWYKVNNIREAEKIFNSHILNHKICEDLLMGKKI